MEKMKKLYIIDIFKLDSIHGFIFEIECYVPVRIKNYFLVNNINYIKETFKNINRFIIDYLRI